MSTSSAVLVDRSLVSAHGILTITLSRPALVNAIDEATADLLVAEFIAFEEDEESKVCIFTGANGNFCAGFDLKTIRPYGSTDSSPARGSNLHLHDMRKRGPIGPSRLHLSKPVIAVIAGHCRAGGFELACWSTLRVVEENAQLGVTCRLRGVPLIDGGTIRLPALIGLSRANDLILTGRTISGVEAHSMGLANRLSQPGEGMKDGIELAKVLAEHPQACMRNDMRSSRSAIYGGGSTEVPGGRDEGRYNVTGREAELMREEYEIGLKSLRSGEFLKAVEKFFKGVAEKKKESKL